MQKNKRKRKKRNWIMAFVAKNDPARYRDRTVKPKKGKGRKRRPRQKVWQNDESN